jgi:hypothetical protein
VQLLEAAEILEPDDGRCLKTAQVCVFLRPWHWNLYGICNENVTPFGAEGFASLFVFLSFDKGQYLQ